MPIFFHNRYDKASQEALSALPEGVQVIDVFGGDPIPDGYRVPKYPYLVDKLLVPLTPLELTVPGGIIQFRLQYEDGAVFNGEAHFWVFVNGQLIGDEVVQGDLFELEIEAEEPRMLYMEIYDASEGFHPWRGIVEVKVNENQSSS